ncbi:MAG: EAL domain-containing protein [Magnetococcales bacterium]|nr:EAL domain-containing protein [Magnetococcales bacterium]
MLTNLGKVLLDLPVGILLHRGEQLLHVNAAAIELTGISRQDLDCGVSILALIHPNSRQAFQKHLENLPQEKGQPPVPLECQCQGPDLGGPWVEVVTRTTRLGDETVFVTMLRDISPYKEEEERIRRQANYDSLTQLPNRTLFMDRLNQEMIRALRMKSRVALMFIDLDRFKWVNDNLGHGAGDELLRQTAKRLLGCHRKSDTVARLGGDEFTVILPDMAKGPFAERVANQVLQELARAFILEGQEVFISGSVGVTVFPDDANNLEDLLHNADTAMYRAKTSGRNAYCFFTPHMHAEAQARMELEKDLHHAIERKQMTLHYQPIIELATSRLIGAEALLRWIHPKRGFIPPDLFIRLAEETGLIGPVTDWMLTTACRKAQLWRQRLPDFFLSANLACTRCRELSTDNRIPGILKETGLPPTALVLEITENILGEDEEKAMAMLAQLRHLGVSLWLDDFGTGQSSLSTLKKLPVTGVKVDRLFLPQGNNESEAVLVKAIMGMAKSLNRIVIGEGVETPDQMHFLKNLGCDLAQGYYFGKPVHAEDFEEIYGLTGK